MQDLTGLLSVQLPASPQERAQFLGLFVWNETAPGKTTRQKIGDRSATFEADQA
jgi:hypothetical protein